MRPGGWLWGSGLLYITLGPAARADEPDRDDGADIEVVGEARVPTRQSGAEVELPAEEGSRIAGVGGDPIKSVAVIGGVGRVAPAAQGLSIWGSAPEEGRLYVDDVPVPRLFHLGSSRSILPAHAVRSVGVIPAAPHARYGRALGGAVTVRTAEPEVGDRGAILHVDPIDAGAGVHLRSGRGWVAASGRHSLLQQTASWFAPDQAQSLVPIPAYADLQLRGAQRLNGTDVVDASVIFSQDRLVRGIASQQPDTAFTEDTRLAFGRIRVGLDRQQLDRHTRVVVWAGADRERQSLDYGEVQAFDTRRRNLGGLLLTHDRQVSPTVGVRAGVDAEVGQHRHQRQGALALPTREGDIAVFGQPPGDRVNADRWTVRQADFAGFASLTAQVAPGLTLAPGLRLDPTLIDGDRVLPVRPTEPPVGTSQLTVGVQPRMRVSWAFADQVRLYAVGARTGQPPQSGDLSPIFGNPKLGPATSWHGVAGGRWRPASWLEAELSVFAVHHRGLTVRAEGPTPSVASLLTATGKGLANGTQASLSLNRAGISGRVAFTRMRAIRWTETADPRPFDREQRHNLQASVFGEHPSGWSLGSRLEVGSGFPRTPVAGAVFNARDQVYDPIFGEHNGERLPAFLALSVRAALTVDLRASQVTVWLDVQNATDRDNVEEIFYNDDYSQRGAVLGLPLLAVVGAEVRL